MTDLRTLLASRNAKLAAGGAAIVATAAFALSRRSRGGAPTAAGENPTRPTYSGAAAYDSTASDVYNSLMPQLEAFAKQLGALQQRLDKPTTTTPKTPVAPPRLRVPDPNKPGAYIWINTVYTDRTHTTIAVPRTKRTTTLRQTAPAPVRPPGAGSFLPAAVVPPPPSPTPTPAGRT